jgi:hypothetical protein
MFEIKNVSSKKDGNGKIIIAINVKIPNGNATERPKLAELNPGAVLLNVCIRSSCDGHTPSRQISCHNQNLNKIIGMEIAPSGYDPLPDL